jgi:membrane protease YdiL (CAAX protease family)
LPSISLKYSCSNCQAEIITKYLVPGDTLTCPICKTEICVPSDATSTDESPNILNVERPDKSSCPPHFLEGVELPVADGLAVSPEPTLWGIASIFKFILAYLGSFVLVGCIIGGVVGFVFQIIATSKGLTPADSKVLISDGVTRITTPLFSIWSVIISISLIYYSVVKKHHNRFFEALHLFKMTRKELYKYLGIGTAVALVIIGLLLIISYTSLARLIPENMLILEEFRNGYGRVILFSIFALLAPFSEELIFRGYVFQGLQIKLGTTVSGIIVTVLFILMHGSQLGWAIIPLLLIGVLAVTLIRVRIKTDSLTKCFVIHEIYNFILILIIWTGIIFFGFDSVTK